ncbi:MAG: nucleoside-diphosphate-sugar epimerase, partial [Kiritimatiellia bacterium]
MTVLITGARGKLAQMVAAILPDVVGLDTRPGPSDYPGPFHRVRRYNTRAVTEIFRELRPEIVLHLGVRAGGFQAAAKERYTQNVLGTRHILEQARRYHVRRVVVMGTYHVYGAHQHNPTLIKEDAPL